jgi:hypothetical protein
VPLVALSFVLVYNYLGDKIMNFYERIDKKSKNDCWLWNGPMISGYGAYYTAGKTYTVHRHAFALHRGHKPKGKLNHSCNNYLCTNPAHLFDMGDPLQHFNYHANKQNKDQCWIWGGALQSKGYGTIHTKERRIYAHRFAFETLIRPIQDGEIVCHTCDNPPCVNPSHLFIGTPQDNSTDMVNKDRQCKGTQKRNAKLTEDDVRKIRALAKTGLKHNRIANRFNISRNHAWHIIHRRYWKHID